MIRFFKAIKRGFLKVFGAKPRVSHHPSNPPRPINEDDRLRMLSKAKVAFVVGHNERAQGAQSYTYYVDGIPTSVSEFQYWSERFKNIQKKLKELHGIYVPIIYRPKWGGYGHECSTVADELQKAKVDVSIHGHFNAASYSVLGCECLITKTRHSLAVGVADYITDLLNRDLGFKERGDDGIKVVDSKHRGSGMIYECESHGVKAPIIFEPAFGNIRNQESLILFESPEKVERVVINTVIAIEKGQIKDLDQ